MRVSGISSKTEVREMFKQAIITYVKSFRWENLKKINRHGNAVLGVFFFTIYPGILDLISKNDTSMYVISIPLAPILLIVYGEMLMQFMVSKEIFLVPMQDKERRKYVNALVGIKILVPTVIGALLLLLWKVLFDRRWIEVIALVFVFLSVEIGAAIRSKGKKYTLLNYFNFSISALIFILMVGVEKMDYELYGAGMYVYPVIGIGVLMMLDIMIFVRQYRGFVENICDYEKMFQISRKA